MSARSKIGFLRYLELPPEESGADWSERNLVISPRQPSAFPGALRWARTPYLRGIFDALDNDDVREVIVEAGAQTGKTTLAYAWLLHVCAVDPGPALVVYPSEDMARSNSRTRVQPLVEDSPRIRWMLPHNVKDDWQLLMYNFSSGANVNWTGANSPAQISSRPIRYLLLDEIDKYPPESKSGEADAVSLAVQRTKTYSNRKVYMMSTPTTPDGSIHRHFLRGDQREYEVRCPRCSEYWRIRWEQVKWEQDRPDTAHLRCPVCGSDYDEVERRQAVYLGRWRSARTEGKSERGVVSFHLTSLCAPWVNLSDLAVKFLRSKTDPSVLRDFVNSDLGEPYIAVDAKLSDSQLMKCEGDYDTGSLRWEAADNTRVYAGCDVQKDYLVLVIRQFRTDTGDSALVWKGMPSTFAELDALLTRFDVYACCVDCRYRYNEVYEASMQYQGIWPAQGVARSRVPGVYELQDRFVDSGRRGGGGRSVSVLVADSNALLDMLADRIDGGDGVPLWEIPRGTCSDTAYVRQMTAMYRVGGRWINPRKLPEHYADAEKLSILAWYADWQSRTAANTEGGIRKAEEDDRDGMAE